MMTMKLNNTVKVKKTSRNRMRLSSPSLTWKARRRLRSSRRWLPKKGSGRDSGRSGLLPVRILNGARGPTYRSPSWQAWWATSRTISGSRCFSTPSSGRASPSWSGQSNPSASSAGRELSLQKDWRWPRPWLTSRLHKFWVFLRYSHVLIHHLSLK